MILVLALVVSATLHPAAPKVGDLITVTFAAPVTLDRSNQYEVVQRSGNRVVLRTFEPKPFVMSGTVGGTRFSNLSVPVASVLKQNDDLTLAPLSPPREPAYPVAPFVAIGIAALCAIAVWALVWWRSRAKVVAVPKVSLLPPDERFRRAVAALQSNPSRATRWAALANETRAYLAATRPDITTDLTTSELVPRLREDEAIVREILLQGDLEKFSPRGAPQRDFDEVAAKALELARPRMTEIAA
jgi:hypothetical protein